MPTSAIDLVTVDNVAQWGNMPSALSTAPSPDANLRAIIQDAITGWSDFVLWRTGREVTYFTGSLGDFTLFQEIRDGNGADSMGVLNGPINTIALVMINGQVIPQSNTWGQFGYYIEQNPAFIGLRRGTGFYTQIGNPFTLGRPTNYFTTGKGNIQLGYKGGYNEVPPSLFEKSMQAVKILVDRRLRADEGGRTTPQTGAVTSYRDYPWDKDILLTLKNFERTMLSFGS